MTSSGGRSPRGAPAEPAAGHPSRQESVLSRLHAHLLDVDPLLAAASHPPASDAEALAGDGALTIEAAREGQLVHAGAGRVVGSGDPDLAILAGDHLYAFALGRLAATGDLAAVAVLAETIAACAQAHAEADRDRARRAWFGAAARIAAH